MGRNPKLRAYMLAAKQTLAYYLYVITPYLYNDSRHHPIQSYPIQVLPKHTYANAIPMLMLCTATIRDSWTEKTSQLAQWSYLFKNHRTYFRMWGWMFFTGNKRNSCKLRVTRWWRRKWLQPGSTHSFITHRDDLAREFGVPNSNKFTKSPTRSLSVATQY